MANMTSIEHLLSANLLDEGAAQTFHQSRQRVTARHADWRANFPAIGLLLDSDEDRAHALAGNYGYTGYAFSGTHGFVDTVMYLTVNHEVAPATAALGAGGCSDCHGSSQIEWTDLGYTSDPGPTDF